MLHSMKLYVCGVGTRFGAAAHPCGSAKDALEAAGLSFEVEKVGGYKNIPFTTRGGKRDAIRELSGQERVPVLVLDDGSVVSGSKEIVAWAEAHGA